MAEFAATLDLADRTREADDPHSPVVRFAANKPLRLDAGSVAPDEALLAFGPQLAEGANTAARVLNLSERGDLAEAAANLFAMLRMLDKSGAPTIAVMPIPDRGLGEAINDRLARAAAPRS